MFIAGPSLALTKPMRSRPKSLTSSLWIMNFSFGYKAVEESWQPSRLLHFTVMAEKQGFDFVCISDHFHPWFHEGGCSGQAWVWIGAAGAKRTSVRLGTGVTTPGWRYHPAQSFATLGGDVPWQDISRSRNKVARSLALISRIPSSF